MKKRIIAIMCVVMMLAGLISGCGASDSTENSDAAESSTDGGESTFTVAMSSMPSSLQPNILSDDITSMLRPVYDPLFVDTKDGIDYYLADKIELSEDSKTYTLHINENAKWSDGESITADDVLFTVEYYDVTPGAGLSFAQVNGQDVSINKIDDQTLEFVLPEVYLNYMDNIEKMILLPAHAFDNDPSIVDNNDYFSSVDMITSGAYTVSEINEDSVVYTARDDYYRGVPNVKKVIMKTIGAGSTKQVAFENGEISYMRITTAEELEKYTAESDKYNVYSITESRLNYLQLNTAGPAGESLTEDARKAIFLALNDQEIIDNAYGSDELATPANSLMTPDQTLYNSDCEGYSQNLEEAKELAKSSGLEGKTLVYIYNADRPNMEAVATVIQQQLAEIGVNLSIEGLDSATFFERFFALAFGNGQETTWDLGTNGWDSQRGSGLGQAYSYFIGIGEFSEEVAALAEEVNTAASSEEEMEKAIELQDMALADYMEYPLTYTNYVMVSQKNVTGLDGKEIVPEFIDYLTINIE